ncbi:MAG TPA: DUF4147 domain-containing protein [Myxococcota bacterium]|nr:DUF4147 domain-containing protein [Myxococcota bacterium]
MSAEGASPRALLEALFHAGLSAVDAQRAVSRAVSDAREPSAPLRVLDETLPGHAQIVALAAGKAACAMAQALEERAGPRLARGLAVTKDGHALPLRRFRVREASHPVPDARSAAAGCEALALAASTREDEVFVVLLSGGASALLSTPPEGVSVADLARTNAALLGSGAAIGELNAVRKHLSQISGGRLAVAAPAGRIFLLAISDVPGDALDVIGSGPCTADPSTFADALAVLRRHGLADPGVLPARVIARLEAGVAGAGEETPKPGDRRLERVRSAVLARNADAVEAARDAARARGLEARVAVRGLAGEARIAGERLAALGDALRPADAPRVLVAGGETTVTLEGTGRGGRNQELALAAALRLAGRDRVALLAAGTDGSDGPTDAAGAYVDGGTVSRGAAAGQDAEVALRRHDSHGFFAAEGGLFRTGPTHTNVMDLALLHLAAG